MSGWAWTRRVPAWAIDWALAAGLMLIGLVSRFLRQKQLPGQTARQIALTVVALCIQTTALVWRRFQRDAYRGCGRAPVERRSATV